MAHQQESVEFAPAKRMDKIRYAIRDILFEAKRVEDQGIALTKLNIGDPAAVGGFKAPAHIIEAVRKAWADHKYAYSPAAGILEAREAVAADYAKHGVKVDPDHVIVTAGLSEAIRFLLTATINPGEQVLLPRPTYPLYVTMLNELGGEASHYDLDESQDWALDQASIEQAAGPNARMLVMISPNNPTGRVFSKDDLQKVIDFCRKRRLLLVMDEVYNRLAYDIEGPVMSVTDLDFEGVPLITMNGLSKNWLLPGSRVGWMVFHNTHLQKGVLDAIIRLANARLSGPTPHQYAVKAALEGPQDHLIQLRKDLELRAQAVADGVAKVPFASVVKPAAAFYAMPRLDLSHPSLGGRYSSDTQVVVEWLRRTGVVTVPGSGFGQALGTHHFTVVTLAPPEVLREAMASLAVLAS